MVFYVIEKIDLLSLVLHKIYWIDKCTWRLAYHVPRSITVLVGQSSCTLGYDSILEQSMFSNLDCA